MLIHQTLALNSIFGCILCGTFVETTQPNFNVTHLFRVDTLWNTTGGTTKERIPFEFDFNSNYDTSEQVFPKDDHKHVFEDFEKDIQFKNNRYITKLLIRKTDELLNMLIRAYNFSNFNKNKITRSWQIPILARTDTLLLPDDARWISGEILYK